MKNTNVRRPIPSSKTQQTGFSLVELIVSMVIGLTVVGAALAMYVSSGVSGRGSSALSQMTEDANIALSLLRSQIAMAGYGEPSSVDAGGVLVKKYAGPAIFGCTGGATSATATASTDLTALVCNDDSSKPDSIVVLYQADLSNTVPTTTAAKPTDCGGAGLTADSLGVAVAENRYYVNGTTLYCLGKHSTGTQPSPQPLVDNIKDLKITYGVARMTGSKSNNVANRYLTAQQISGTVPPAAKAAGWNQVTSAHICILISSESAVLDKPAPYYDCRGTLVSPATDSTDKHLYRAFATTVVLQNRLN